MQQVELNRIESTKEVGRMVDAYMDGLRHARENGKKVCWAFGPPGVPLLMRALDVEFMHLASWGAYSGARQGNSEQLREAEAAGFLPDVCSYNRLCYGLPLILKQQKPFREDLTIPLPDFMYGIRLCHTHTLWSEAVCRLLDVPCVTVDIPGTHENSQFERNVDYVEKQLKEVTIPSLERLAGRRLDYDKLSEMLDIIKRAAIVRWECFQFMKNTPAPMSWFDSVISLGPVMSLGGLPGTVEYYENLKAELQRRVDHGIAAVPGEKYRLYWDGLPCWYKLGTLARLFAGYKAVLLASAYTHGEFWRHPERIVPDKPLRSLAEEWVRGTRDWLPEHRVNLIAELVQEYALDGLVMSAMRTCRVMDIGQHDIINEIERKLAIPGVLIETDPADVRFFTEAQYRVRLEAFLEMIDARRAKR